MFDAKLGILPYESIDWEVWGAFLFDGDAIAFGTVYCVKIERK